MIDHDRLFKELLSTFFLDFLALFTPEVLDYLDPDSIAFLDKELFTDVTAGEKFETDLLVQAQFRNQPSFFLVHVENQSSSSSDFGKRMFRYFARLFEQYDCPVYPIVVFSYERPQKKASSTFTVDFPDFSVMTFNYKVIQLNQLNWRDYLSKQNPVASALMSKMKIASEDRAKVKAECLRLLVTLRLDPARMQLISGFVDTYLKLNAEEEEAFKVEIGRTTPQETKEDVMQIVTSWMQQGIEQGRQEGQVRIIRRLLHNQLGELSEDIERSLSLLTEQQIEQLTDDLPTIRSANSLSDWLSVHSEA